MEHLLIHKLASFAFLSLCRSTVPFLSAERLCADPRLSPHALLAPDMALPTVFAEMIDNLATDEGAATRYEERREGGREGERTLIALTVSSFIHFLFCTLLPLLYSSLFDTEVAESRTVLHILDLVNRGYRLPAVPWEPEVRKEGREGGRAVHLGMCLRFSRRQMEQ